MITRTILTLFASSIALVALVGCGDSSPPAAEYSKDSFSKQPPPAGYMDNVPKAPQSGPPPGAKPGGK